MVRFRVQQSVVILITLFKKSSTHIRSRASQGCQFLCFYIVRALVRIATVREQHRSELKYVTKLISGQVAKQYRLPQKKKKIKGAGAKQILCSPAHALPKNAYKFLRDQRNEESYKRKIWDRSSSF